MIGIHYNVKQKFTQPQNWMVFEKAFTKEELEKIENDLKMFLLKVRLFLVVAEV